MSGSSIGKLFTVTGFGESHGPAIGCIVDGCPAGLPIDVKMLQHDLDRRKPGTSKYTTQRKEADEVEILSGVFEGKTTGTPIGLLIRNTDQRSKDYSDIANKYRPGHADFSYDAKFGFRDYRGGGRASARETAMRVAAAGIAKAWLKREFGTEIAGYVAQIGDISIKYDDQHPKFDWQQIEENPFFCPEADTAQRMAELVDAIRKQGNSIGARVNVVASNIPAGLGEPIFDRLDAEIAHSLMSINAVKGVEVGDGFAVVGQKGTEHRDEMTPAYDFKTNHAGGVLGGISSGQNIRASIALKPTSSLSISGDTVDRDGNATDIITKGRHDPCVGIRAVPIAEAMLAITLMDHALRQRGQNGRYNFVRD